MIGQHEIEAAFEQHTILANRAIEIHGDPSTYIENMDLEMHGMMAACGTYANLRVGVIADALRDSGALDTESLPAFAAALCEVISPENFVRWFAACYHEGIIVGMMLAREAWGD